MKCRICQSIVGTIYTVREMMFGFKDEFEYFKCDACGALQISQVPGNISKYYPEDLYYSYKRENEGHAPQARRLRKWVANKRNEAQLFNKHGLFGALARIHPRQTIEGYRKYLIDSPTCSLHARILDIGCGNGWLLCEIANLGFDKLLGIDPYISGDIDYPNGVHIKKWDIDSPLLGQYDLILLNHSLEHMFDQYTIFARIKALLLDNGICRIEIPVTDCAAWHTYKTDWVEIDAPRHFCLHTKKSMSMLADRTGLELFKTEAAGDPFGLWGSELYQRDVSLYDTTTGLIRDVKEYFTSEKLRSFEEQTILSNNTNTASVMTFYLRNRV